MSFYIRKGSKWGAKKVTFGGRLYHSKKEAGYAAQLELQKKATNPRDRVVEVKPQYIVDVYLDGATLTLEHTTQRLFRIIPDFLVTFADGSQQVHEVKGAIIGDWMLKWRMLEAVMNKERPGIELVLIR